jgi:hypothetical protein
MMKETDLKKLINIIIRDGDTARSKCCFLHIGKDFIYQEIKSIIIHNKNDFQFFYNQFHTQMSNIFNISLEFLKYINYDLLNKKNF